MPVSKLDERRRITLTRDVVEEFDADEFVAIAIKGEGILLKPLPRDPLKTLQKEGEKFRGKSIARLRREAYEEALKEAGR